MVNTIKSWLPESLKMSMRKTIQKVFPPRIRVTKFVKSGCLFEITTDLENYRITSFGEEADSIEKVLSEINPGDVFFDIGSCVGLYTLHAAILGCKVVAFEPDPRYRKRLKRNIKINRLGDQIQIVEWAVSDTKGVETLYTDGVEGISPSLREVGSRGSVKVETDSIDNAINNYLIPYPDIIKMDIEGAEILALRGMKNLLSSSNAPRFLSIEFHPGFLPDFNSSFEECKQLIAAHGYFAVSSKRRFDQYHFFYRKGSSG